MNNFETLQNMFEQSKKPEKAQAMKKYMKDNFEFFGLQQKPRKELTRQFFKENPISEINDINAYIKYLWQKPQREFQYFALDVLEKKVKKMDKQTIELAEYMIINKSWWDTVDLIASKIVGDLCLRFPELIESHIKKWNNSDNLWLQRTSILYQLKYKELTNTKLLKQFILKHAESKEFFLRKAIGWILREYSKTNPEFVEDFIKNSKLSPLSVREGMKVILKKRL